MRPRLSCSGSSSASFPNRGPDSWPTVLVGLRNAAEVDKIGQVSQRPTRHSLPLVHSTDRVESKARDVGAPGSREGPAGEVGELGFAEDIATTFGCRVPVAGGDGLVASGARDTDACYLFCLRAMAPIITGLQTSATSRRLTWREGRRGGAKDGHPHPGLGRRGGSDHSRIAPRAVRSVQEAVVQC
jgi:hypothetical protein